MGPAVSDFNVGSVGCFMSWYFDSGNCMFCKEFSLGRLGVSVERLTSAQVMISWPVSSSPASGSVLTLSKINIKKKLEKEKISINIDKPAIVDLKQDKISLKKI